MVWERPGTDRGPWVGEAGDTPRLLAEGEVLGRRAAMAALSHKHPVIC